MKLVVADDFHQGVDDAFAMRDPDLASEGSVGPYDSQRLGGTAIAKNIILDRQAARVRIVVNGALLAAGPDASVSPWAVFLIAHELAHPILERRRRTSGALEREPEYPRTATEAARAFVRSALDELHADLMADIVLGHLWSVEIEGQDARPVRATDLEVVLGQHLQVADVLDSHVHPGWPDLVDAHRNWRLSVNDLYVRLFRETDQMLTLLGHAQAEATWLEQLGPLEAECSDHPGAQLYLADVWRRIMKIRDESEFSTDPDVICEQDLAIVAEGEAAVLQMWQRLGLTFDIYEDRGMYIHVDEPLR
ncbi:hypothetical protein GCM10009839_33420 [Catenulispora yoronensis]|uniref:Peptidase M48 domain-containing protein n=1 Tax=Catenulispora yoronensis TaxID=450799 RepID=A0ABN2U835_9ACTN